MTVNRRTLAKGAVWATPVIAASTLAPAIAASPCAVYKKGQPLPASAFTVLYVEKTNEGFGGSVAPKQLSIDFGFKVSDEARACGVTSGAISSSNSSGTSRARIGTNNSRYNMTNGGGVPANGEIGSVGALCQLRSEACGTSGGSPYSIVGSTNTSGSRVTGVSIYRKITVAGYGESVFYINAVFPSDTSAAANVYGSGLHASSVPDF